jgi:hypothetical protein
MAIRKRADLDSHMAALNDVVKRGKEGENALAVESRVKAKLVEQLRQSV